jgi:hypothetical protein
MGGLFTFASSVKRVGVYQRFGFWPQRLTSLLDRPVSQTATATRSWDAFSETTEHDSILAECRAVTDTIYEGLDVEREIQGVADQGLADTILLADNAGIEAFAVCHIGPGSEAGSDRCYVKVGAVRPAKSRTDFRTAPGRLR